MCTGRYEKALNFYTEHWNTLVPAIKGVIKDLALEKELEASSPPAQVCECVLLCAVVRV